MASGQRPPKRPLATQDFIQLGQPTAKEGRTYISHKWYTGQHWHTSFEVQWQADLISRRR